MATSAASKTDAKAAIESALADMRGIPLPDGARALLNALGYKSARAPTLPDDSANTFVREFPAPKRASSAPNAATKSEREFKAATQSVSILFQVTDAEIAAQTQPSLIDAASFDDGRERSFIFAAAELRPRGNDLPYSRGHYARFAREINKRFRAPVVALFQTQGADEISIAFIGRRQSKTDAARDVLEKASVIRGVNLAKPHAAHIQILGELALDERRRWMTARAKPQNFDGLLEAWLDALDTDALNKEFYQELFKWFERALDAAQFPPNSGVERKDHIIRMLTRLIFIWFIKEKGLVCPNLFIEERVKELLIGYDRDGGDSYYRAVLQNLFFATLNTEIEKRRFSRKAPADHRNAGLYRYKDLMAKPDDMLTMFKRTPFVNGGLFDCLDDFEGVNAGGRRVDCFTDNTAQRKELCVPNSLFFGKDNDGLIDLFNRYKFTVEENTPLEQEVALDPELLGNVFENLLAATTRETQETARKQTGSYYTPRAVVDYMVDESLVAALSEKVAPDDGDKHCLAERLRQLLDYGKDDEAAAAKIAHAERKAIVAAVARLKIIDPAVGSGAFPMGILHKLTLALRRIDPDNELWRDEQVNIAVERTKKVYADEDDAARREETQRRINAEFERHKDSDFGRKLYLIQNAIYGVDIQPIAAQIAKLRFFISLAIEQTRSEDIADNYGFRALPNLETRFVAANTLIGLRPGGEFRLMDEDGATREINELNELRARHISTADRAAKLRIIAQEKQAQARLATELDRIYADWDAGQLEAIERKIAGLNKEQQAIVRKDETAKYEDRKARFEGGLADAKKIAAWKPLDQNAPAAEWFDAEYMFAVKDGFDVVIGNPPYVQLQKNGGELRRKYQDAGFATFASTGDIYQLFYEKGVNLLTPGAGRLCFISSNQWMRVDSGRSTREFLESQNPETLVNLGADVFDNVTVNTCILTVNRAPNANALRAADVRHKSQPFPPTEWGAIRPANGETWVALSETEQRVKDKMEQVGTPLKDWDVSINYGLKTGYNKAFIIDNATRDALIASDPKSSEIIKPVLSGRDIQRYASDWKGSWLIYLPWHFPLHMDASIKGASDDAERAFKEQYPAIYNHLLTHKARLSARNKTETGIRYEWYALQRWGANYHQDFAKDKIVWGNLANRPKFAHAAGGTFISAPSTMLTPYDPYLLAVLNSGLADWYFKLIGVERDGGYYEYKPMFIERIPVPQASASERAELAGLVDEILSAKARGGDTGGLEGRVDGVVCGLYGLSPSESAAIARSLAPAP